MHIVTEPASSVAPPEPEARPLLSPMTFLVTFDPQDPRDWTHITPSMDLDVPTLLSYLGELEARIRLHRLEMQAALVFDTSHLVGYTLEGHAICLVCFWSLYGERMDCLVHGRLTRHVILNARPIYTLGGTVTCGYCGKARP